MLVIAVMSMIALSKFCFAHPQYTAKANFCIKNITVRLQKDEKPISIGKKYGKTKVLFTKEFADHQLFLANDLESEAYATTSQNPHKAQYAAGLKQLKIDLLAYLEQNLGKDVLKREGTFRLRGMVDRDKNMKNVQIVYSKDAKIGKALKKWFEQPVGAWIPELQGGGPVKSYIDVFIKFKDAQLEIETCKPNRAK